MEGMKMLGKVVHFKKNGEPGEPYPLIEGQTSIGAHGDADIRLKIRDPNLEDVHCIIEVHADGTAVILNKSIRDPVRINAVTVRREQILKDHDIFEICNKKFQYRKCVPNSAHKSFKESLPKKRYTLSTNVGTKTRSSLLTKTPQAKRTSSINLAMKKLSRTVPRKSVAKPRPSRKLNTSFESHSFNTSLIRPDIKNASVKVLNSMSKAVSGKIAGSSASSKRLSLGSSVRLGKINTPASGKRLSNKATPRSIQRKSLAMSAIKDLPTTSMEDVFTEEVLAAPLEKLNKSVESDTVSQTGRRSKRTPKLLRYSSDRTPISLRVSSSRRYSNKTPSSVTRNSIRKSPNERSLSRLTESDRKSLNKTRTSKMQSLNSSSPVPEHRVSSKRRSSMLNNSHNSLSGVEELFIITSSDSSSLHADNQSDAEQDSLSSLPSHLESNIEGNISAKLTLPKSINSMDHNYTCPSGEDSLEEERLLLTTPRSELFGQYSLISPSVRSSARVKKIPKKYDNTVCSLVSFDGTSKSESDIKRNSSTPKPGDQSQSKMVLGRASHSLTPQHSQIDIKTPKSIGKHADISFVESTPIPKPKSRRTSMNISKNSSIQQIGEACSSMTEMTPQKGTDTFSRRSSRVSQHSATSHNISLEKSIGNVRKMRSSLTLPSSPLDSVIVNVDSDSCTAEESVVCLLTPKERTSSSRRSKMSTKTSSQTVDVNSVMFTTPENNMSVVEISDAITPSPARGKKSKSVRTSSIDMNTTPKNIPQEEAGFKTPLTTPALFENLKNSALRSRKRLNKSLVKSIRMSAEEEEDSGETSSDSEKRPVEHSGRLLTRSMRNNSDVSREESDVPTTGIKRGRESCDSVRKTSKKAKLARYSDNTSRQSLDLSSSTSEMIKEVGNSQTKLLTSMNSNLNNPDYQTSMNRSRLSLAAPRQKRSIIRHSLQDINICTSDRQSFSNTSNTEPSLQSSSCHSLDTSVSPADEPTINETNADWHFVTVSSEEASHLSCQSSNDSMNMSGARRSIRTSNINKSPLNNSISIKAKKLLKTPKSPLNDLTDVAGIAKLMRTPKQQKSPSNDLTKVHGIKRLMKTPKQQKSPLNDLTKVHGVKKLMKTPKQQKSPLNDLTKVHGVKKLMRTPRQQKSPLNDLTKVHGVKKLLKTPRQQKSPLNDLTKVPGVKKLMKTPRPQKSPVNDLTNVRGLKKLMATPRDVRSPKNDLTDVPGVKKLMSTPKEQKTPQNDLSDVTGVKQLFTTRRVQKSPLNDLTDVKGVKELLKSPKIVRTKQVYLQKSPRNDLTNVAGVKQLMRTPKLQKSPKNDLSNIPNLRNFVRTPRVQKQPSNDLTDVEGVKRLYLNEEAAVRRKSANVAGIETLFQVQEDIENVDLFSNIHKKPLRTYRGKTLTPSKPSEAKEQGRKTLGDIPMNSPHVEKWVEEQIRFINMQTKEGEADGQPASDITSHLSKEVKANNEDSASETPSLNEPTSVPKTRSRRKPIVTMVDSPRRTTRKKQLVVEIESTIGESHEPLGKEQIETDTSAHKIPEKSNPVRSRRGRKLYQVENEPIDNKELHEGENPVNPEMQKRTRRHVKREVSVTKQEKVTEESTQSRKRRKVAEYVSDQTELEKDVQAVEVNECTDSLPKRRTRKQKQVDSPVTSESSNKEEQIIVTRSTRRNKLPKETDSATQVNAKKTRRKGRETPTVDEKDNDGPVKSKRNQKESEERKETVEKLPKKQTKTAQESIVVLLAENEAMTRPNRRGRPRKDAAVSKTEDGHSSECASPVRNTRRNRKNAAEHSETKDPEVRLKRLKGDENVETVGSSRSLRSNRMNRAADEEEEDTSKSRKQTAMPTKVQTPDAVPEQKTSRRAKKTKDQEIKPVAPIKRSTRRKQ